MSYFGTTQASTIANPPRLLIGGLAANVFVTGSTMFLSTQGSTAPYANSPAAGGGQVWLYNSTNATTDMTASNFFSDAANIGMKAGDIVLGIQFTSAGSSGVLYAGGITAVTTAGANLSTGGTITSTFN